MPENQAPSVEQHITDVTDKQTNILLRADTWRKALQVAVLLLGMLGIQVTFGNKPTPPEVGIPQIVEIIKAVPPPVVNVQPAPKAEPPPLHTPEDIVKAINALKKGQ